MRPADKAGSTPVRHHLSPCARRLACRAPESAAGAVGATLLELMFAVSIVATLGGIAIPAIDHAMDDLQTAAAARYVAARIGTARLDAVRHARVTALRFEVTPAEDYAFVSIADGNGNGVRTAEVRDGTDHPLGPPERLRDKFSRAQFALMPGTPDVDGDRGTGTDGVRVGSSQILSMSADGTSSSGTLYIRGRRSQYAVRVLGVTGRVRMLEYQVGNGTWINR